MGAKAKRNDMQKESLSKVEQTLGDIGRDVTRFERSAPPRHKIGLALPSLVSSTKAVSGSYTFQNYARYGIVPNSDLGGMSGGPVFRIVD